MDKEQEKPDDKKETVIFIFCANCGREKEDPILDHCDHCIDELMAGHDGR